MIDLHTHILPCLDDGAQSVAVAAEMLQAEKLQGVSCVVFTPHYYGKYSPQTFIEKRREAFESVRGSIPDGLDVRLGAEVHFTGVNVPDYDELCSLAIEGTKYILLEFPFTSDWTKSLLDSVADFIADTGYTPIVAHVERYLEVLQNPALISRLIEMGCLLQVNADSFARRYTKSFVFALLKRGWVHCIGTDAHDITNRPPDYTAAKKAVADAGYAEEWKRVEKRMENILRGEQVCVEYAKPVKKFFGKYR